MAVIKEPRILILDEPFTGVDPLAKMQMIQVIKGLKETAVLFTTHRIDEAELLCDRIAIMKRG